MDTFKDVRRVSIHHILVNDVYLVLEMTDPEVIDPD